MKRAVEAALAICAMNKREMDRFSKNTPKAPQLDKDVDALMKEKPDILPGQLVFGFVVNILSFLLLYKIY